jgi:hypothetical protein
MMGRDFSVFRDLPEGGIRGREYCREYRRRYREKKSQLGVGTLRVEEGAV